MTDVTDYHPGRPVRTKGSVRAVSMVYWAGWGIGASLLFSTLGLGTLGWVFVIGAPFAQTALVQGQARRYNQASKQGHLALTSGDFTTAQREFSWARARFRWPGFLRRLGDYNRAFALIREGQLDVAIALLSDIDRRGGVVNLDGAIAGALALAHGLAGNVALATEWLAETRRRYGRYSAAGTHVPAFAYVLAEAVVKLRAGDVEPVRKRLENQWTQLENTVTGNILRPMRVLRAFALAQTGGPREAAVTDSMLAALRGTSTHDIAYLGVAWPEMKMFMASHGL